MDRKLSAKSIRKRNFKQFLQYGLVLIGLLGAFIWVTANSGKTAIIQSYMISEVKRENLKLGFDSYGTIETFYKEIVCSPLSANVAKIYHMSGDTILPSDTLISFDLEKLNKEIGDLKKEVQIKKIEHKKLAEAFENQKIQQKLKLAQDSIQIAQLRLDFDRNKYLFSIGGGAKVQMEKAQMNLNIAQMKFTNALKEASSSAKSNAYDLQIQGLETELLQQKLLNLIRQKDQSFVKAKNEGVLLNISAQLGQSISEGSEIATLNGINHYKVNGELPIKYSNRIRIGQKVEVKMGDNTFEALLMSYSSNKQNNALNFQLRFAKQIQNLISGLRCDLRFIEEEKQNRLYIANGGIYQAPGLMKLFVLEGSKLVQREVSFGGSTGDKIEIISGLNESERVIVNASFYKEYNGDTNISYEIPKTKH